MPQTEAPSLRHAAVPRLGLEDISRGRVIRLGDVPAPPATPTIFLTRPTAVAFSARKNLLASSSPQGLIRFWDPLTEQVLDQIQVSRSSETRIAFNAKGTSLISTNPRDDVAHVWTVGTLPDRARRDLGPLDRATAAVFSPDGSRIAIAERNLISLWDAAGGQQLARLQGHADHAIAVAFSPDGKRLASAGLFDRELRVWEVAAGRESFRIETEANAVFALAFSPNGRMLAWGDWSKPGLVHLFDLETKREVLRMKGHQFSLNSLAFSPDGKTLATGGTAGVVDLWDLRDGTCWLTLDLGGEQVSDVAFSPGGTTLATAGSYGSLLLWKLPQ